VPSFSFVEFPCYVSRPFLIIKTAKLPIKYILAILNSQIAKFWMRYKGKMQGNQFQVDKVPLMSIPIIKASEIDQQNLIRLVDKIITEGNSVDCFENYSKMNIVREYEAQIDQMVYKLYGLTSDEIKIIENHG